MPNRRISGVVTGLIVRLPRNNAVTIRPAANGDQPNSSWNSSGSRNGTAVTTSRYTEPPVTETRSVRTRRTAGRIRGAGLRSRCRPAIARHPEPASSPAATQVHVRPVGTHCFQRR